MNVNQNVIFHTLEQQLQIWEMESKKLAIRLRETKQPSEVTCLQQEMGLFGSHAAQLVALYKTICQTQDCSNSNIGLLLRGISQTIIRFDLQRLKVRTAFNFANNNFSTSTHKLLITKLKKLFAETTQEEKCKSLLAKLNAENIQLESEIFYDSLKARGNLSLKKKQEK